MLYQHSVNLYSYRVSFKSVSLGIGAVHTLMKSSNNVQLITTLFTVYDPIFMSNKV